MTISAAQFRIDYPEFQSVTNYPDSTVNYWLNLAYVMLNPTAWSSLLDIGVELFTAHNLVIERQNASAALRGGLPGQGGLVNSKSVDKVSVGYDTGSQIELEAGHWNLTNYGTRFIRLARMAGAGGVQL
jgi:hypothetical protein